MRRAGTRTIRPRLAARNLSRLELELEALAVAQDGVRIIDFRLLIVVHVHLDPEDLYAAWEIGAGFGYVPFEGAGIWGMRYDGPAKRIHPAVAEVAKVSRVAPCRLVPELKSYIREVRVWRPGNGKRRTRRKCIVTVWM